MEAIQAFIANPYVAGFLAGAGSAALVDYRAFREWKSFNDAMTYQWGTALFRWFQGGVTGLVTAFGIQVAS